MPARKIPKNHLFVTGSFASSKTSQAIGFESLLEKEYMMLLDFDEHGAYFESQPITIPVEGVARGYTPDLLVRFIPDAISGEIRKPLLTEIKHSDELRRNAEKYAGKFRAAEAFANEAGWEFRVTTEAYIRTPRLANLKFLREYRNIAPDAVDHDRILTAMRQDGGISSPQRLLTRLSSGNQEHLHWLPVVWHSILIRLIVADLEQPLTHETVICLPEFSQ